MKIKSTILFIVIVLLIGPSRQFCHAQASEDWQPVTLNIYDGTNSFSGVEGYYMLTTCNGAQAVLLKLVNHNNYSVKAGWEDMVVLKNETRLSSNVAQDSVVIGANSEIKGNCTGNRQLMIKLTDFGTDKNDFSGIITSHFDFIVIH